MALLLMLDGLRALFPQVNQSLRDMFPQLAGPALQARGDS